MRNWMIKHWYFNWNSKIFGKKFGSGIHLRVVNTLIVLFCVAGLITLFVDLSLLAIFFLFLPFFLVFIPATRKWITAGYTYEELDWEQKRQYLLKKEKEGLLIAEEELGDLEARFAAKYNGNEKFVEAWRIAFPFLVIILTFVIYAIFGEAHVDFPDRRFF